MTPQESQLVDELFDRLARLETGPRDPDAERAIADGARRAPHALYALVQTALVQDEALKRANARIEDLQAQLESANAPPPRQGGFLDSMREAFGAGAPRGSVSSVRAAQSNPPLNNPAQNFQPQTGYPPPPGYAGGAPFGGGGSFLGTAASTAAGVIGGALLLDGIRSTFGHHGVGGFGGNAFAEVPGDRASPWASTSSSAADSQLARDAGIDHIGDHIKDADADQNQDADDDTTCDDDSAADGDMDDADFSDTSGGDSYDA